MLGAAAGAVGTVALDVSTYFDMAIRGRPSSQVPTRTVERLAITAGVPLARGGPSASAEEQQHYEQQLENRASGLGALMGYGVGVGVGAAYGALRPWLGSAPVPLTALALGCAAMAGGDLPSILTGTTNPKQWGTSGWLADIVPHLAYGLFTALAFEAISGGVLGRREVSRAEYIAAAARHAAMRGGLR